MAPHRPHATRRGPGERLRDPGARASGVDQRRPPRQRRGGRVDDAWKRIDAHRQHRQLGIGARAGERVRDLVDGARGPGQGEGRRVDVEADAAPSFFAAQGERDRSSDLAEADDGYAARRLSPSRRGERSSARRGPRCGGMEVRAQRRGAVEIDRGKPPARPIAPEREQDADDSRHGPRHGDLARAQERHVVPAQPPGGMRGKVGIQIRRGGEEGAHHPLGPDPVDADQLGEEPRRRRHDALGIVPRHRDRAPHGGDRATRNVRVGHLLSPAAEA